MLRVVDLTNGLFDVVDCESGERYRVSSAALPGLLRDLGAEPRAMEQAQEPLTEEAITVLVGLWRALDRHLSQRAAAHWTAASLVPCGHRHQLGIDALRSQCEHDTGRYVPRAVMAAALAEVGIVVDGDCVFAR